MSLRRATLLLTAALVVGGAPLAAPAQAAFPGANGKLAYSTTSGFDQEVFSITPQGDGATNLTNTPGLDQNPAWSPDGRKIAFERIPDGGSCGSSCNSEIYVMNADGSGQTRLTNNPTPDTNPSWSPDGSKIAFATSRDGNGEIYVMNADGTAPTNITQTATTNENGPAWSPDGAHIAFYTCCVPSDVYVMNADGGAPTRLTNYGKAFHPNWSPDGAKIAFTVNHTDPISDNDEGDIYVMNADGTSPTALTSDPPCCDPNFDDDPAWSPDGREIVFGRSHAVYVMHANGTGLTPLTTTGTQPTPDWQPLQTAAYAHPQGAPSLSASLVPTFRPCGTGANPTNGQHSPPLGTQACLPPTPGSNVARVGSTSTGSASVTVVPGDTDPTNGDQGDVTLSASLNDVKTTGGADYVPNASGPDLTEITRLRLTDKANNYGGASGTATEYDFRVPLDCAATSDPSLGSTCSTSTSADSLLPGFITEERQTVVQAFRVRVDDAGANGTTGDSDDRIFATQGIYIP